MNSARQMMEQLFHYGHFVVMHMDKVNKGDEQRSTDNGTVISLQPLCSDVHGQDKGGEQRSTDDGTAISGRPLCSDAYVQDKQKR